MRRNNIVDRLIEECTNVIDENKIYNVTLNTISSGNCTSCRLYVTLFVMFLTIGVIIGISFVYFYWYKKSKQLDLKKDAPDVKYSKTETLIY